VNIRVKSITSALPAAKRNLIPSRKSMRKLTGLAYPSSQGFSPTNFFFLVFPENLDTGSGITVINR
jgi:hypothetical protein